MKDQLLKIWNNILESFDGNRGTGFSARKLSSFVFVVVTVFLEVKYTSWGNLWEVCTINAGLITSLLGISAWQQTAEMKNKKQTNETN